MSEVQHFYIGMQEVGQIIIHRASQRVYSKHLDERISHTRINHSRVEHLGG